MLKKKKIKKPAKLEVINLKLTKHQHKAILAMAKRFAQGNMSAWLRAAGLGYVPKRVPVPLKISA